jgi:hypothetical protein
MSSVSERDAIDIIYIGIWSELLKPERNYSIRVGENGSVYHGNMPEKVKIRVQRARLWSTPEGICFVESSLPY